MTDLDYKNKKNSNSIPENASHANDDDLYAASLIDRVKEVKHTKGTLYFVGITFIYLLIGIAILLFNYNEVINSPSALFDIFRIQKVQIYTAAFLMIIPIFWLYYSMVRKINEVTTVSEGLLNTALRLTHPVKSSEKAVSTLSSAIRSEISHITNAINEVIKKSSDMEKSIAREINQIESSMSSNEIKLMEMVNSLKSQKEEIIDTTSATKSEVEELLQKFHKETSELDQQINLQVKKLSAIDEEFARSMSKFDDTVEKIEASSALIKDNSDEISSSLNSTNNTINDQAISVRTVRDELELTLNNLNKLMSEQNLRLEDSVGELSRLSDGMNTKILDTDQLLLNFKNEMEPKLSRIYEGLSSDIKSLGEISHTYETNISDMSATTIRIIDEKLAEELSINKRLSDHLKNISEELKNTLSSQIISIEEIFKDINSEAKTTIEGQKFEIEKSFDQKILEFNAKTKMMMEAIKDITNDTTDKLNMTIKEILQTIKLNFNDTSKAADLEFSNIRDNMHEQLIGLSASLLEKSEELSQNTISSIEGIQNNISSSIDGFRLEAGNTSSDIANEISATTSKLSAEMVNVQKETLNKINSEINQISNSYNESLLSLAEVTEKLVKNLDDTRSSIKRDIFELPDETNQHLNKMRGVIEEQIEAIGHLNLLISEYDINRDIELAQPQLERSPEKKKTASRTSTQTRRKPSKDWILPEILSPKARMTEKKTSADNQRLEILENEILDFLKFDYEKLSTLLPNRQPYEFWEAYYNGASDVISERDYSRTGRKLFNQVKSKYSDNKKFRSLVNKYLKSFEEIVSNHQKANNEKEISQFLDSESGILFFLVSHSIGKLD